MSKEPSGGWSEALGEHAVNPPTPSVISAGVVFALDKEWSVPPIENRIKAQFEQWVRRSAERAIHEMEQDGSDPDTVNKYRSAYLKDRAARKYNWEVEEGEDSLPGSAIRDALDDLPGMIHLFYLLLKRGNPNVTEKMARQIFKSNPKGSGRAIRFALGNLSPKTEEIPKNEEEETLDP